MNRLRRLIYRLGFRPKRGSIFFSPSIHLLNAADDATKQFLKEFR